MAVPSPGLIRTVRVIDRFTDVSGTVVAWLNVPLVIAVSYEVFALCLQRADDLVVRRRLHALRHDLHARRRVRAAQGAHIRTDFFFERWSIRTGVIDSVAYLVFFFPAIVSRFSS